MDESEKERLSVESPLETVAEAMLDPGYVLFHTLRSCPIGISRFLLAGLVGFFRGLLEKNRFRLVLLITFFNRPQTRLKQLKKYLRDYVA